MKNYRDNGQHTGWIEGEVRNAWFRLMKWQPKPLHGCGVTLSLRDGSEAAGHYMIVESGAITTCCNPFAQYRTSRGFPRNHQDQPIYGAEIQQSVDIQHRIRRMANKMDGTTGGYPLLDMDEPIVCSFEGVVMCNQQRAIAGALAAKYGTDAPFIDWLRNHCSEMGFSAEDVSAFPHPRLVVVLRRGAIEDYNADAFAAYEGCTVAYRKLPSAPSATTSGTSSPTDGRK